MQTRNPHPHQPNAAPPNPVFLDVPSVRVEGETPLLLQRVKDPSPGFGIGCRSLSTPHYIVCPSVSTGLSVCDDTWGIRPCTLLCVTHLCTSPLPTSLCPHTCHSPSHLFLSAPHTCHSLPSHSLSLPPTPVLRSLSCPFPASLSLCPLRLPVGVSLFFSCLYLCPHRSLPPPLLWSSISPPSPHPLHTGGGR
ncbi:hypothetical protein FKM82_026226 [Ascaphus truei]